MPKRSRKYSKHPRQPDDPPGLTRVLPTGNNNGYLLIDLFDSNGKRKIVRVDKVVATTFVPNDDPVNKTEVWHVDFDKENSRADNLIWVTPAQLRLYEAEYDMRQYFRLNRITDKYKLFFNYAVFKDGRFYNMFQQRFLEPCISLEVLVGENMVTRSLGAIVAKLFLPKPDGCDPEVHRYIKFVDGIDTHVDVNNLRWCDQNGLEPGEVKEWSMAVE